jgi:hypothetical protein
MPLEPNLLFDLCARVPGTTPKQAASPEAMFANLMDLQGAVRLRERVARLREGRGATTESDSKLAAADVEYIDREVTHRTSWLRSSLDRRMSQLVRDAAANADSLHRELTEADAFAKPKTPELRDIAHARLAPVTTFFIRSVQSTRAEIASARAELGAFVRTKDAPLFKLELLDDAVNRALLSRTTKLYDGVANSLEERYANAFVDEVLAWPKNLGPDETRIAVGAAVATGALGQHRDVVFEIVKAVVALECETLETFARAIADLVLDPQTENLDVG